MAGNGYKIGENGEVITPGPRSTNEILVTEETRGSMPNNEKDASKFSLIDRKAVISSLKAIYSDFKEFSFTV